MADIQFAETTNVGDKVFFAGPAVVSDKVAAEIEQHNESKANRPDAGDAETEEEAQAPAPTSTKGRKSAKAGDAETEEK